MKTPMLISYQKESYVDENSQQSLSYSEQSINFVEILKSNR